MLAEKPLPSPDDLPQAEVLIYDGHCVFCKKQVRTLHRLAGKRLAFLSLHDDEARRRVPDLSHEDLMEQMYLVDRRGIRHGGAAAVRHLSCRLPLLWPLAPLLHLPGSLPLWQAGYRWVAKRRYRLAGKECEDGTCSIHFGDKSDKH